MTRRAAAVGVAALAAATFACSTPAHDTAGDGAPGTTEASAASAPFVDVTVDSGVDFRHWNGATGDYYFPEIMGGGAALFDYDADGDLDLYLVQGAIVAPGKGPADAIDRAPSPYPPSDRLYRNDLDLPAAGSGARLRFTDVTAESGVADADHGMGVAAGDYDNDGYPDLYVTGFGRARLLRNRGDGIFEDRTEAARAGEVGWSVSAAFVDVDRDGWLDLFVGNYVDATAANHKVCRAPAGYLDYCGPLSYNAVPSRLLHNRGDGTFDDDSVASGITARYGPALGIATADFDGDGWIDVYVANDQAANQLWRNRGDGTFADDALLAGCAVNAAGRAEASMGVDAGDFDGDGDDDLFMTNLTEETNTLYVNDGHGVFRDATATSGLGPPSLPFTGFGTAWLDWDHDGWLDLLVANGAVVIVEALQSRGDPFPFHQPDLLFRNLGDGRFEDATARAGAPFAEPDSGRGVAFGDLDNDGDVDVVIANVNGPTRLLRNDAADGTAWLGLRLIGAPAGMGARDLLGARAVLVRDRPPQLARRSRADGSYASANDPRVLFGLGRAADDAPERVRVTWPDGKVEEWDDLAAGRYHTLRQGEGRPVQRAGTAS
ncbi:MAG TPA: CRTAC1 family protein [Thermoanaerobaculia bacterium]|nr:CRTAC1 family protein [Thermoanaerobaculia bacterium]